MKTYTLIDIGMNKNQIIDQLSKEEAVLLHSAYPERSCIVRGDKDLVKELSRRLGYDVEVVSAYDEITRWRRKIKRGKIKHR